MRPKIKRAAPLLISFAVFIPCVLIIGYVLNNVVVFQNPETAFRFSQYKNPDITIIGEESALVVAHNGDETNLGIILKSEDGWKIGSARLSQTRMVYQYVGNGLLIKVWNQSSTNDYYVIAHGFGIDISMGELEIYDECGSEFINYADSYGYRYYAYIKSYDGLYTLYINDEMYELDFYLKFEIG